MLPVLGFHTWLAMPELGIERIAAKVDTGARTSALHARDIKRIDEGGSAWVEFTPPLFRIQTELASWESGGVRRVRAALVDERLVKSSMGMQESRFFVRTWVLLQGQSFETEFSLTSRAEMRFPVLLGRSALRGRFVVDVSQEPEEEMESPDEPV
jgi:hypothetical protein